jgi:HEAT repeat protein
MSKPDSFTINSKVAPMILLITLGFTQTSASLAQQAKGGPVTVASVSSRPSANGTVVSIAADGPLNRAQTWQDREGYHVVVPSAGTQNAIKAGKGIKVRQLDRTLEIVVQTKPGANVTVQPMANRLNLSVDGKLDSGESARNTDNAGPSAKSRQSEQIAQDANSRATKNKISAADQEMPAAKNSSVADPTQTSPAGSGSVSEPTNGSETAQSTPQNQDPEASSGEFSVMSGTTLLIVFGLGCVGLLLLRRRRSTHAAVDVLDEGADSMGFDDLDFSDEIIAEGNTVRKIKGIQENLVRQNGSGGPNGTSPQRKSVARMSLAMPASLYGAYQVDQEIGKLVLGQPHKMDVVASRAPDDRRAIEASLLKTLVAADADEDLRCRARAALEEYGFVARQSAALLQAADPYERTSAARMLGDVKSPAALPFLLEALYDHEALVRNQAVLSIGELKLPSAIGALLDIARKHPDVPGGLLSRALSACSVEGLDFFDGDMQLRMLSGVDARVLAQEIIKLEPASVVQELPESADDDRLSHALLQIESQDIDERSEAIKVLAQFSVKTSVAALGTVARHDPEASLRALTISSLAFINHESVFPAILIAMADDSREVRAAAARSLSRLSFDRADAYIRVTETDDAATLRDVAQACIKAGIAAQGIDRLASGDHQAYEALSVVSLLLKANTVEPLLEAIANHPNMDVRLTTTYILGMVGQATVLEQLRQLAIDATSESVKNALLETVAKLEAPQNEESAAMATESELEALPEFEVKTPSQAECQFQFESEAETQPEGQLEPLELESSGLPGPSIA